MTTDAQPTLSAAKRALLAQRLRQRPTAADHTIPRRPAGELPPLSFAQERVWFMEQYAPGTLAYTIPLGLRLRGRLRVEVVRRVFEAIVGRHETLRTRFPETDDGVPVLAITDDNACDFTVLDAVDIDDAMVRLQPIADRPFDVATDRLLRVVLARISDDDHLLFFAAHHIISDGWSTELLVNEFEQLYAAFAADRPSPLPELRIQYGDFAAWQRRQLADGGLARGVAYWRDELAGVEPLELPTDRPRPAQQSFAGASIGFSIDAEVIDGLTALGREHGATLYMVLLAAFQQLLSVQSGQREFAVGSPLAGRPEPELEDLVGMFVNVLALRARLDGDPTFVELLARTRETSLAAYDHQHMPFAQLVAELRVPRDVRRSPIFQAILAVQNYTQATAAATHGLRIDRVPLPVGGTRFDIEMFLMEHAEVTYGTLNYNSDLFDRATIEALVLHFQTLLRAVLAEPGARLSELDLIDADERALVLTGWNDTAVDFPAAATQIQLVERQVDATPDASAVTFGDVTLTYAQLDGSADRVAAILRGHGAGPGTLVGICAERSLELVVGLLGILKSGAAYVPLDPDYPADRLAFMLADAQAPLLLTQRHLPVPPTDATVLLLDDPAVWSAAPAGRVVAETTADDVAYMIYTSGSTGQPKGVPNGHRGIVNRLDWMQKTFRLDATDTVLQKTPASFDVSVWEFFWPLIAGARLVLAEPGGHRDPDYLRALIEREQVTTLHFVPSMLTVFLAQQEDFTGASLRRIICSGEELPAALADECLRRLPGAELHNLYGPTEAAIDVTWWRCRLGERTVPIGAPIQNVSVYVLDEALRPVPVGSPGELHIGGVGLALGYHRRPELTAERFIASPYGRLYKTGDVARWRSDGVLEFLGRKDFQVKLRGLRIELGEIEAALRALDGASDAVVVVRDGRLIGYVVGEVDDPRTALKRTLPDYMVPNVFVTLDALPLSPSGKLDRTALPAPVLQRTGELAAPSTETEAAVVALWAEVLEVGAIGVDDDFFDLGGHSLLAMQVVARLRKAFPDSPVGVMDLFKNPTVRELAAVVDTPLSERGPQLLVNRLTRGKPAGPPRLSFVCVPYGGGSAVVYQPLADALPVGYDLWAVSIPGHDVGLDEASMPFRELARRCAEEVLATVPGPIALYGHCGVGSALIVEIGRLLEQAGRELEAVYIGAMFPFARPRGRVVNLLSRLASREALVGDRVYHNWLKGLGVNLDDMDDELRGRLIGNLRRDSIAAEDYFTERLAEGGAKLRAPIIAVVGERDPVSVLYQERYQEWGLFAETSAVVLLDEAGHFFLKHRSTELAEIVTQTHPALHDDRPVKDDAWELVGVASAGQLLRNEGPQPSMRRFLLVAGGQMASIIGSALTEFAIPLWILLRSGSLFQFGLYAVVGLVPGLLVAPLAGALVDRLDRRRVMLAGDCAAGLIQLGLLLLIVSHHFHPWQLYVLLGALSVALTFQRLAWGSAVPQLVPKHYLGHANGVVQMAGGMAQFLVPLVAAALLATIHIDGILTIDVASYAIAIAVVVLVRFPRTMPWRRQEPLGAEISQGFAYAWRQRHFRAMLLYFAALNLFLAPVLVLVTPLVLTFGDIHTVAKVAVVSGLGATVGGVAMGMWGGPDHRRMRGVLIGTAAFAGCAFFAGLAGNVWVVAIGAFGMYVALTLINGIYTTIVQVKVPQRFHGRVFAINTLVAWSTLPLGFAVIAPYGSKLFEPLMARHGSLSGSVGAVIGTGPGRGIGLMYLVFGVAMVGLVAVSLMVKRLASFDDEVPDADVDDLIGARIIAERAQPFPTEETSASELVLAGTR